MHARPPPPLPPPLPCTQRAEAAEALHAALDTAHAQLQHDLAAAAERAADLQQRADALGARAEGAELELVLSAERKVALAEGYEASIGQVPRPRRGMRTSGLSKTGTGMG